MQLCRQRLRQRLQGKEPLLLRIGEKKIRNFGAFYCTLPNWDLWPHKGILQGHWLCCEFHWRTTKSTTHRNGFRVDRQSKKEQSRNWIITVISLPGKIKSDNKNRASVSFSTFFFQEKGMLCCIVSFFTFFDVETKIMLPNQVTFLSLTIQGLAVAKTLAIAKVDSYCPFSSN